MEEDPLLVVSSHQPQDCRCLFHGAMIHIRVRKNSKSGTNSHSRGRNNMPRDERTTQKSFNSTQIQLFLSDEDNNKSGPMQTTTTTAESRALTPTTKNNGRAGVVGSSQQHPTRSQSLMLGHRNWCCVDGCRLLATK